MARAEPETKAVAMSIGDGLKLEADGRVCRADKATARADDVAVRDDLPPGHPLYGSRAVRCVPCGMGDCVIVEGKLVPVDLKTGLPIEEKPIEPKPVDEKPIDEKPLGDVEVVR